MSAPRACFLRRSRARLASSQSPAPLAGRTSRSPSPDFVPPAPGTYTLHRIMAAPDGRVLRRRRPPAAAVALTRATRITLLGFIYTTCIDPEGCPLAYRVFDALKDAIAATPAAARTRCGS